MAKSNFLENELLDHVLRNTSYTPPTTVYLALYTSNPGEDNSGTEVSGGSYARQAATFSAASGGSVTNSSDISFTDLPEAEVTHVGILDAATAGNLLYYASISKLFVSQGGEVTFSTGNLTISEA